MLTGRGALLTVKRGKGSNFECRMNFFPPYLSSLRLHSPRRPSYYSYYSFLPLHACKARSLFLQIMKTLKQTLSLILTARQHRCWILAWRRWQIVLAGNCTNILQLFSSNLPGNVCLLQHNYLHCSLSPPEHP